MVKLSNNLLYPNHQPGLLSLDQEHQIHWLKEEDKYLKFFEKITENQINLIV